MNMRTSPDTFLKIIALLTEGGGNPLGLSKKLENMRYAIALYFAYYDFCRLHRTLKTTPAVAAGLTDHRWTLEELLLDQK